MWCVLCRDGYVGIDLAQVLSLTFYFPSFLGQRDINKPKNRQLTIRSWWPRPSAFVGSALEVGWWSPACEAWYQNRLRQIANRTADLISSVEWKKNLKLERKCIPYLEGVEKCSKLILTSSAAQFHG